MIPSCKGLLGSCSIAIFYNFQTMPTLIEICEDSILNRIESPKTGEERVQGSVIKSIYDALNIDLNKVDMKKIQLNYWQFFSSPWASNIEYEERHLELTK